MCLVLLDELNHSDVPEFVYYMNDGVYGSFVGKLFGNTITAPSVHKVIDPHLRKQFLYFLLTGFGDFKTVDCFSDVTHPR